MPRTPVHATARPRPSDDAPGVGAGEPGRGTIGLAPLEDLRILDANGRADPDLDPDLPADELRRIHRAMVLTRVFDVRMLTMQRQGKMGTFAPGYGQEATQIGQVYPLAARDWFAPSYRSFGAQIWRGWPMDQLMLLWDGFFAGFPPPPEVNDLPFCIVIGSHVLPAVGVAQAAQYRGEDTVVLTNFGDGALSQGAVCEALNFAAVGRAPVIFVCENNGWAISTPVEAQAGISVLAQRSAGFGMPGIRVDGNDVLAVIVAAQEAADRARRGDGPTFIEAVTYRMGVHTTADDPKVYRSDDEVKAWQELCPLRRFETYLRDRSVLDEDGVRAVHESCEEAVLTARASFYERARANPREVFDFMYAGPLPPDLAAQRDEYLQKLDRANID